MATMPMETQATLLHSVQTKQRLSAEVIVIGGGLSGLQAALDVQQAGLTCLVLEYGHQVGGTVSRAFDTIIDPSRHTRAWNLAKEHGVELETAAAENDPRDDAALPSELSEEDERSLIRVRNNLEHLSQAIEVNQPSQLLPNYGTMSVHELVKSHGATPVVQKMAAVWTQLTFGLSADDVSGLFFLSHCKSAGGFLQLLSDLTCPKQTPRLQKDGLRQLCEGIASRLQPGSMQFMQQVRRIDQSSENKCVLTTGCGDVFQCSKIILATPAMPYGRIEFTPSLSKEKEWLRRLDYPEEYAAGFYAETTLMYDHPWWRERGFSGYRYGLGSNVSITQDTSSDSMGIYSLTWFVGGESGRDLWVQQDDYRQQAALANISSFFEGDTPDPIYRIGDRGMDEYIARSTCLAVPAAQLREWDQDRWQAEGNLHFVGADTSQAWRGHPEGALAAGARGAEEVVSALRPSRHATSFARL